MDSPEEREPDGSHRVDADRDEAVNELLSPLECEALRHGLTSPRSRRVLAGAENAKAEAAVDEFCEEAEIRYLLDPASELSPYEIRYLREQWRRSYRRMKRRRVILEKTGSVCRKCGEGEAARYTVRFRTREGGRTAQHSIYLGDGRLVPMALYVLVVWRKERAGEPLSDLDFPPPPPQPDPLRRWKHDQPSPTPSPSPGHRPDDTSA